MERKYKIGDKVRLVKERVEGMNIAGGMDCYLGEVMTISSYSTSPNCYRMKEDDGTWCWNDDMIKGSVRIIPVREIEPGMVIHCPTEEKAEQLLRYLDEKGYRWRSGLKLTEESFYWYGGKTCYWISIVGKYVDFSSMVHAYSNSDTIGECTVEEFDDLFKIFEEETIQSDAKSDAQPAAAEDVPEIYPILPGTVIYCETSEEAVWFLKRIREDGYEQICCNISNVTEDGISWSGMCYSLPKDETRVTMMSLEEAVSAFGKGGIVRFSDLIRKPQDPDLTPAREIRPGMIIHCPTKEKSDQLLIYLDGIGYKWNDMVPLTHEKSLPEGESHYGLFREKTCYFLEINADPAKVVSYGWAEDVPEGTEVTEFDELFPVDSKVNPLSAEEAFEAYLEIRRNCPETTCKDCPLGKLQNCSLNTGNDEISGLLTCLSEYRKTERRDQSR